MKCHLCLGRIDPMDLIHGRDFATKTADGRTVHPSCLWDEVVGGPANE